jgi:hypothetical protein
MWLCIGYIIELSPRVTGWMDGCIYFYSPIVLASAYKTKVIYAKLTAIIN